MNFKSLIVTILLTITATSAFANNFRCSEYMPEHIKVSKPAACNGIDGIDWWDFDSNFSGQPYLQKNSQFKNLFLELTWRNNSNLSGAKTTFPNGASRTVYRGSYMGHEFAPNTQPEGSVDRKQACLEALVNDNGVNRIVNYDELDWASARQLGEEEKEILLNANPNAQYIHYTDTYPERGTFQHKFKKGKGDTPEAKKKNIFDQVATIIKTVQGSSQSDGNVFIHCYGGVHRTGVVFGVIQKCFNKVAIASILDEYRCHAGYVEGKNNGGVFEDNIVLLNEFPCEEYVPYWKSTFEGTADEFRNK